MESKEQLLSELRQQIKLQLEMCDVANTPIICQMKSDPKGYKDLEDLIIRNVADRGFGIGEAIIEIEKEFDINRTLD